jgi:hypothetical protein
MGYIPYVVMSFFKEGHIPTKYLIGDQVAPEPFLGSYPPRSKTKDQPMPQAWVPWTFPGALGLSRGLNCLVLDQEPQSYTGGPLRGLYCLVLDQEPQSYWGPYKVTKDQPMPRHGYPGLCPRAHLSGVFTAWF